MQNTYPGGSEYGDVQANECNHSTSSIGVGGVVGGVLSSSGTNSTNDELHDDHTSGTEDQDGATSDLLNHDERSRSREHVDKGGDERDQERIADAAKLLEENGAEVKDEVDTIKILVFSSLVEI